MGIKDPSTYGDWFWKNSVEASELFDEQIESAFSPYFQGIMRDLPSFEDFPSGMRSFIEALSEPPSAGFGGFALGVGVEMIDETLHTLMNPMMKMMGRSINRKAKETWLTGIEGNLLFRRGKIEKDYWNLITESEGYEDIIARQRYEAEMPYPTIPDLVLYARYHGDPDNTKSVVWDRFDVPAQDYELWEWLALQRLTTMEVQTLFKRGLISDTDLTNQLAQIGWSATDRPLIQELGWKLHNKRKRKKPPSSPLTKSMEIGISLRPLSASRADSGVDDSSVPTTLFPV